MKKKKTLTLKTPNEKKTKKQWNKQVISISSNWMNNPCAPKKHTILKRATEKKEKEHWNNLEILITRSQTESCWKSSVFLNAMEEANWSNWKEANILWVAIK
jgi:hypothetical protein